MANKRANCKSLANKFCYALGKADFSPTMRNTKKRLKTSYIYHQA